MQAHLSHAQGSLGISYLIAASYLNNVTLSYDNTSNLRTVRVATLEKLIELLNVSAILDRLDPELIENSVVPENMPESCAAPCGKLASKLTQFLEILPDKEPNTKINIFFL